MEGLVALRDRAVLVTGHTGFKGGWLTLWLADLGAHVHGYALAPPTEPSLFEVATVARALASDTRADLADLAALTATLERVRPEVVFHLAAQPLVSEGYRDPLGTIATNVTGTANLLEAIRAVDSVRAVVVVASDKVYENPETGRPFRERDPLGGHDPYSASKAAAEIVVASYRSSFFGEGRHPARIATARAGNVIGGGDWAGDRLVPDCIRAFVAEEPARLRHPAARAAMAARPRAPLRIPGARLAAARRRRRAFARAWNFGPDPADDASVSDVAHRLALLWGSGATVLHGADARQHEAGLLRLDSTQARSELGWTPRWSLEQALEQTVAWYRAWRHGDEMRAVCMEQIATHSGAVAR